MANAGEAVRGAVPIVYYSDVLCVWAYLAQLRVNEVRLAFGDRVKFEPRFCSVFGDTRRKLEIGWKDRGGYGGFNAHLRHSMEAFPEISIHPDLWLTVRPASSSSPQLFLKAVETVEADGAAPAGSGESLAWSFRRAFFEEAEDIATRQVQLDLAEAANLELGPIEAALADGRAHAALASDYQDADAARIQGSPTFVLNDGRQKLYGNVGYRIIEANILELLRAPREDQASWC